MRGDKRDNNKGIGKETAISIHVLPRKENNESREREKGAGKHQRVESGEWRLKTED